MSKKKKNDDFIIVEGDIYRKAKHSKYSETDYYCGFVDGPTSRHHFYIETLVAFLNEYDFAAFEEKWEKDHLYEEEMGDQ